MTLKDLLGWSEYEVGLEHYKKSINTARAGTYYRPLVINSLIHSLCHLSTCHYLYDDIDSTVVTASELCDTAQSLFEYPYTEESLAKFRAGTHGIDWMDPFIYACQWGAALGRWEHLSAIASGVLVGLEYRRLDSFYSPAERELFLAIARLLQGASFSEVVESLTPIAKERQKRVASVARFLLCIGTQDAAGCTDALKEHCKVHRASSRFRERDITYAVSGIGTFMFHFAMKCGVPLTLDETAGLLIVRLPASSREMERGRK